MRSLPILVALVLVPSSGLLGADVKPSEADVRKTIARGLPYLEKEGLAWIKQRNCMSCHNVSFMLWAHNEAKAHGVDVDAKKLAEWNDWSLGNSLSQHTWFQLSDTALESLRKEGLPETIAAKLKPLVKKGWESESDLLAALKQSLAADEVEKHKALLIKHTTVARKGTVNDGGGLDTLHQLLLGRGTESSEKMRTFLAKTPGLMLRWQESDGSWSAAGQLPSRRGGKPVGNYITTAWTILALGTIDKPDAALTKAREQARDWLNKAKPDKSLESLAVRLLLENQLGKAEAATALRKELLDSQNKDGGWSWLAGESSDAYCTGLALYALHYDATTSNEAIQSARKFLVDSQSADGSWNVPPKGLSSATNPDRIKRLDPIYRYWGSAWATIGLARSLPAKQ